MVTLPPLQKVQLDRVAMHDMKRVTYQQTKSCSETLLLLGQVSDPVAHATPMPHPCHTYPLRLTGQCNCSWRQIPPALTITLML